MKEPYEKMLRHMAWADRRIGKALEASHAGSAAVPAEAIKLYAHIVSAERNWLSRLEGGGSFAVPLFPDWDAEAIRSFSEETISGYGLYLEKLDHMERMIFYRNSAGAEFHTSVSDILMQVFLHGSHHRGQINTHLRGGGLEPVAVDYILFAREQQLP